MELASSIKRAPKWAWYTVAGVGAGGFALHMWRNRAGAPTGSTGNGTTDQGTVVGGGSSPIGTIVPPVIVPPQDNGDSGIIDSVFGFTGNFVDQVFGAYQNIWGPIQANDQNIINTILANNTAITNGAIDAIARAGSSPPPPQSTAPSSPVVAVQPTAPAVPTATGQSKQPDFQEGYRNVEHDNGKSGRDRKVWCVRQKLHIYPDSRGTVVVSQDKLKDGHC